MFYESMKYEARISMRSWEEISERDKDKILDELMRKIYETMDKNPHISKIVLTVRHKTRKKNIEIDFECDFARETVLISGFMSSDIHLGEKVISYDIAQMIDEVLELDEKEGYEPENIKETLKGKSANDFIIETTDNSYYMVTVEKLKRGDLS